MVAPNAGRTGGATIWFSFHGGHNGESCRHARGTLADVLAAAHARGFTTYGCSEHAPRDDPRDLYPEERDGSPEDLARAFARYSERAASARSTWAGRLEVLVGFETEVLPLRGWAERMRALRAGGPFDYVVGSVHHVGGFPIDFDASTTEIARKGLGGRDALDRAYFDQVAEMIDALRPEVVGHLDLVRKFRGTDVAFAADTWPRIERALEAARASGACLDVNAAQARRGFGPVYPAPEILVRAQRMGIPVTLGDDSHAPEDVGVGLDRCLEAIAAAGYAAVTCLTRRDGALARIAVPIGEVRPRLAR